jgi:hypothetical protein
VAQDAEMELLDNIGHWLCGFRHRGELPWKTKELPLGICSGLTFVVFPPVGGILVFKTALSQMQPFTA